MMSYPADRYANFHGSGTWARLHYIPPLLTSRLACWLIAFTSLLASWMTGGSIFSISWLASTTGRHFRLTLPVLARYFAVPRGSCCTLTHCVTHNLDIALPYRDFDNILIHCSALLITHPVWYFRFNTTSRIKDLFFINN